VRSAGTGAAACFVQIRGISSWPRCSRGSAGGQLLPGDVAPAFPSSSVLARRQQGDRAILFSLFCFFFSCARVLVGSKSEEASCASANVRSAGEFPGMPRDMRRGECECDAHSDTLILTHRR
jgi:hypothetical protein